MEPSFQCVLRRRVGRRAWSAEPTRVRSDEHEPPARAADEVERRLREGDEGEDVHLELASPVGHGDELHRPTQPDAGVVHETVEPTCTDGGADLGNRVADLRLVAYVEDERAQVTTDVGDERRSALLSADPREDRPPGLGQGARRSPPRCPSTIR
jgi:hypothetical protein